MSYHTSTSTWFQRAVFGTAGVTAAAIGLAITFVPASFYASYGITLDPDPNLMSELRAPGANLAALGLIMIAGAVKSDWLPVARLLAITVFFAFAFGRLVSWGLDGAPGASVQAALVIELIFGAFAWLASGRNKATRAAPSYQ